MQLTGVRLVARLEVVGGLHGSLEERHRATWLCCLVWSLLLSDMLLARAEAWTSRHVLLENR